MKAARLAYSRSVTATKPRRLPRGWIIAGCALCAWALAIGGVALVMWGFGRLLAAMLAYPLAGVSG